MENILEKELASLNASSVDWKEVKLILSNIVVALNSVLVMLPAGIAKNILSGVIAGLNIIISLLPA